MRLAVLEQVRKGLPEIFESFNSEYTSWLEPRFNESFNGNIGVLCLSEVSDSLLMWGHYTDCHRGFAVGFNSESPFFARRRGPDDEFGFLRQVQYQLKRPNVNLSATTAVEWFLTKSNVWAYEREWRIMRILSYATKTLGSTSNGYPVCLFEFEPEAVAEIILGLRANELLCEEVKGVAHAFPSAKILQAREDTMNFALSMQAV